MSEISIANVVKAAVFDLDGVILNSMSIWKDMGVRYVTSQGLDPEEGLSETLHAMSMEMGADYLRDHYDLGKTSEEIMYDLQVLLQNYYFNEVALKRGAKELLQFLAARGITMAAATSSPRTHVTKALERCGVLDAFDFILTTTEVGESKYSPKIYNMCAAGLGAQPSETLVFEDSLYALKTAGEAGFHTVGVFDSFGESNHQGMQENSEIYLKKLSDFADLWKE